MKSLTPLVFALFCFAAAAQSARGEHAVIDLLVISGAGQVESTSDQEPPAGGVIPRPKFTAKAGEPLVLQFVLTNVYPHGVIKDAVVRYFIVRTDEVGKKSPPPELRDGVITQGRVVMNLKPKCRVGARLSFHVDEPGVYMVRVDTQNTNSEHEHFSAIDLEVK